MLSKTRQGRQFREDQLLQKLVNLSFWLPLTARNQWHMDNDDFLNDHEGIITVQTSTVLLSLLVNCSRITGAGLLVIERKKLKIYKNK